MGRECCCVVGRVSGLCERLRYLLRFDSGAALVPLGGGMHADVLATVRYVHRTDYRTVRYCTPAYRTRAERGTGRVALATPTAAADLFVVTCEKKLTTKLTRRMWRAQRPMAVMRARTILLYSICGSLQTLVHSVSTPVGGSFLGCSSAQGGWVIRSRQSRSWRASARGGHRRQPASALGGHPR